MIVPEPRKHTILPRNRENFSEASNFFGNIFCPFWSFLGRIEGTLCFRTNFFTFCSKSKEK